MVMRKGLLLIVIALVFINLASGFQEENQKERHICIFYFYENEKFSFIEELKEEFPFVDIVELNVEKNYSMYLDMVELYNASENLPIIFIGNEWYVLEENETDSKTIMKNIINEFEIYGNVSCPYYDGEYLFPKPVCILEFYDFNNKTDNETISLFNEIIIENITYVNINKFDVSLEENEEIFYQLCNQFNATLKLPAIFIGEKYFSLNKESLNDIVNEAIFMKKVGVNCAETDYEKNICIVFFYDPLCKECVKAKKKIEYLKIKYPLNVTEYNILTEEGINQLFSYYAFFNVSKYERGSFAIFIGKKYFYKNSQLPELEEEIKKYVDTGLACPKPTKKGDAEEILRGFTIFTVALGGLADGVNPCAFATLIFFIAYLEKMKHKSKSLLAIGISFSIAVFIGYLAIGLGILEFYYQMENIGILSEYIYIFAGIFSLIIASLNAIDYFRMEEKKAILQLPMFLKKRRGRIIKILTGKKSILILSLLAFIVGLGISLLEFVCTGQILFPIMAVIKSASPLRTTAFLYLLLYNFMFIVPLLLILSLFYIGYNPKAIGEIQRKRNKIIKAFTTILLTIVGIYMLIVAFS